MRLARGPDIITYRLLLPPAIAYQLIFLVVRAVIILALTL
jgi:hypothetical protein